MKLKKGDYLVYLLLIIAILFSFKISKKYPLNYVEVDTPYKKLIFNLKQYKVITVKGKIGKLSLVIKYGKVRVLNSDCKNKICVKTGWISSANQYIACVPNGILIKLVNSKNSVSKYDFITK